MKSSLALILLLSLSFMKKCPNEEKFRYYELFIAREKRYAKLVKPSFAKKEIEAVIDEETGRDQDVVFIVWLATPKRRGIDELCLELKSSNLDSLKRGVLEAAENGSLGCDDR